MRIKLPAETHGVQFIGQMLRFGRQPNPKFGNLG